MHTNAQSFLHYRPAPRAALAGVAWIDPHCLTASLFRFAHQNKGKLIPCCISNALGKAMVFEHPNNVQVLNRNKPEAVDQLARFLVGKVGTPKGDPLMHTRDRLAAVGALRRPCGFFAHLLLGLCQCLFVVTKEPRVSDLLAIREGRKGRQTHINPNGSGRLWQGGGSVSTEKQAYHLPLRERDNVTVLGVPSSGRCRTTCTAPILLMISRVPSSRTPFSYCG